VDERVIPHLVPSRPDDLRSFTRDLIEAFVLAIEHALWHQDSGDMEC
jgi:hypothetical protein